MEKETKVKGVQLQAIIKRVSSRVDNSLSLSVSTPELSHNEKATMFGLQGINLKMEIIPTDVSVPEMVKIDKELKQKTQSERIRAVLFLLWKQEGSKGDCNVFYYKNTEKYIEELKGKLED